MNRATNHSNIQFPWVTCDCHNMNMHYVHLSCSQSFHTDFGEYSTKIRSPVKFSMDGTLHSVIRITMQTCAWMFLIDSKKLINSSDIREVNIFQITASHMHLWLKTIIYEFWTQKETQLIRLIHIIATKTNSITEIHSCMPSQMAIDLPSSTHCFIYYKIYISGYFTGSISYNTAIFHGPTIFGNEITKIAASQRQMQILLNVHCAAYRNNVNHVFMSPFGTPWYSKACKLVILSILSRNEVKCDIVCHCCSSFELGVHRKNVHSNIEVNPFQSENGKYT